MTEIKCRFLIIIGFCFFNYSLSIAQPGDKRIQYPSGLKNAYFGFNLGYIQYPFSSAQVEPGFTVESVKVPHIAPRFILYGYQFNKYLGAQISYMRPVDWVSYQDINGDKTGYSVWMNVGGLTLVSRIPLAKKISIATEAGLGVITRKGFSFNDTAVVKDAVYATGLFGGALQYHVNKKWDLQAGVTWSPAHRKEKQPQTLYYSAGFNYHLKELSKERVDMVRKTGSHFPSQLLQLTLTTNLFGYFVNDLFSKTLPLFWGGAAQLQRGVSVNYQRNLFHTRKIFSLDWGAGIGYWRSKKQEDDFFTLSLYPVLRFMPIRSPQADFFFEYTVAGPTFISRTIIDNEETGRHFTFYDAMGIGMFAGRKKQLNAGIRIAHFSNGNIFPRNNGVMVPLSFSLGYAFQ